MLAIFYEAKGELIKAQEILLDLFEDNPCDAQTVKRLVSLFRDMDMENEAISILNKYIEQTQDDCEAWQQLADIYCARQNFSKAMYCYEEIVSSQPRNYMINLRYAECIYSSVKGQDSFENLQLARKYFSHAAILKEGAVCIRALYGEIGRAHV